MKKVVLSVLLLAVAATSAHAAAPQGHRHKAWHFNARYAIHPTS